MVASVSTSINDDAVPRVPVNHIPDSIPGMKHSDRETWEPRFELFPGVGTEFTGNEEITITRETRDVPISMDNDEITTNRYNRRRRHDLGADPLDHVIDMYEVNDVTLAYRTRLNHIAYSNRSLREV